MREICVKNLLDIGLRQKDIHPRGANNLAGAIHVPTVRLAKEWMHELTHDHGGQR